MSIPKKKPKSTWRPLSKAEKEVAKEVKKKYVRNLKDIPATQKIKNRKMFQKRR